MSWYLLHELPPMVIADLKAQKNPDTLGWTCGCMLSKDRNEVWFCTYHSGYYDAVSEMEEQMTPPSHHDPLCESYAAPDEGPCICLVLEKAREKERDSLVNRIKAALLLLTRDITPQGKRTILQILEEQ